MTMRTCECCRKSFQARTADVNRGWARFCSKSCKAMKQAANGPLLTERDYREIDNGDWDGWHGQDVQCY